jgi:hypothetical protein
MVEIASLGFLAQFAPSAVALVAIAYLGHQWIKRVRENTERLRIAASLRQEFYKEADKVLLDPATPELLQEAILSLVEWTTDDAKGAQFTNTFIDAVIGQLPPGRAGASITKALDRVGETRPDLVQSILYVVRTGVDSLVLQHAPSDHRISLTLASASQNRRWADALAKLIGLDRPDHHDGHRGERAIAA